MRLSAEGLSVQALTSNGIKAFSLELTQNQIEFTSSFVQANSRGEYIALDILLCHGSTSGLAQHFNQTPYSFEHLSTANDGWIRHLSYKSTIIYKITKEANSLRLENFRRNYSMQFDQLDTPTTVSGPWPLKYRICI
jgi:hypothetical protein